MKVGSLVECIGVPFVSDWAANFVKELPVVGIIYTVRGIKKDVNPPVTTCIYLEEIVVGHLHGNELACNMDYFREVQPPQDLSEILEYQHPKHLLIN